MQEVTIGIAGAAGDGLDKSGDTLAKACGRLGLHVYAYNSYQSIIRGGHIWLRVRIGDEKVYSHGSYVDQSSPSFTVRSPCSYTSCWYDSTFGVYLESIDISKCTPIKTLGYKIFTLDVNYLIPPASMQGDSNFQAVFSYIQQYLLGSISSDMTSCASSSTNAYSATTPADLTAAIQSMFAAIPKQSSARISQ